jgi:hypothetical protein
MNDGGSIQRMIICGLLGFIAGLLFGIQMHLAHIDKVLTEKDSAAQRSGDAK